MQLISPIPEYLSFDNNYIIWELEILIIGVCLCVCVSASLPGLVRARARLCVCGFTIACAISAYHE